MAIVRSTHLDPPAPPIASRRAAVLAHLQEAAGPAGVADVARSTGLHVNTARFHLDGLVAQGRAQRHAEQGGGRGRPRILYTALVQDSGPRSFRLLAEMLTGLVGSLDPRGSAARDAGRAWGRSLVSGTLPGAGIGEGASLERLDTVLDEVGFRQTRRDDEAGIELRIHHCPFVEVARQDPDVVCTLHRGLLEGAVEGLGAPLEVEELRPFAERGTCLARLRSTGAGTVAGTRAAVSENRGTPRPPGP